MKDNSKQQSLLKRKPLKGQLNRQVKFSTKSTQTLIQSTQFKSSMKSKIKQYQSIENVSLIQGSSFISNKQDGSMDSMDKMIIGVSAMGIGEKQFQEDLEQEDVDVQRDQREDRYDREQKSKGSGIDFDFNQIHKQYERLIGRNQLLGEQQQQISDEVEQSSRVLPDEDDWQIKKLSFSLSPQKISVQNQLKQQIMKIQKKIEEIKPKRLQDNSNNSIKILVGNLGNLSQIHEQRQNNLNISVDIKRKINNNQQDQQEFIDFVSQPDPQGKNLHENENQNQGEGEGVLHEGQVEGEGIVNQWQQSPMFEHHLEIQLQNQKQSKKTTEKHIPTNYQQILQALNSKQQSQVPTYTHIDKKSQKNTNKNNKQPHDSSTEFLQILKIRQDWIKLHPTKSQDWKKKQLGILGKMRIIFGNPLYDFSQDEEDSSSL